MRGSSTCFAVFLAMRVRNAVWRPPFVMYYRTFPLPAVRSDLTAAGFSVTAVPLTALGRGKDGGPRGVLVLARRAGTRSLTQTLSCPAFFGQGICG